MKKLSIAYFGTPDFSAYFLEKLIKSKIVDVKLVVTQEDKPAGRKQILKSPPVAEVAAQHEIFLTQLEPLRIREVQSSKKFMSSLQQSDLTLVFAFGAIIPKDLLDLPKYGFWNIHPSLLPKYRGASPVAGPLLNGDKETGVTLMKMDEKMDHGPIIARKKLEIRPKERRPELTMRLTNLALEMFIKSINQLLITDYGLKFSEQKHKEATYTKLLKKDDGYIEITKLQETSNKRDPITNEEIFNKFRGLYPWPGIWTTIELKTKNEKLKTEKKRLKITDMDLIDGKLVVKRVQLEGKKEVDFATFNKVYKIF